jgi:hypothetical protein
MSKDFTFEEIYPNIFVYNNVFEDPERMYKIAQDSINDYDEGIWEKWQDWYEFGKKIEKFGIGFDRTKTEMSILQDVEVTNKIQEDQKYFITELVRCFHVVNNHYMEYQNFPIDKELGDVVKSNKTNMPKWNWTGPSLCRYYIDSQASKWNDGILAMRYHSDYVREPIKSPGYKFVLTTTTYLNDDYLKGGVDFAIGDKLVNYKPKAGDFLVFPSGHPNYLTKDGEVYLHAAENCKDNEKYFTRMYWTVFEDGSDEWREKEALLGDLWPEENKKLVQQYNMDHPARNVIEGATRIR